MAEAAPPPRILVLPEDGIDAVIGFIAAARESLAVKQFNLSDTRIVKALLDAHRRRVAVRVMLNPSSASGERYNDQTFAVLGNAGIPVRWSSPAFSVTHEKSIVVDGVRALIGTFNMTPKNFESARDYGVILEDKRLVDEIVAGFEADWSRRSLEPDPTLPLVWGGPTTRKRMAAVIDGARKKLYVQHAKFVDATIVERLGLAARRGVKVLVLCGTQKAIRPTDFADTMASLRLLIQLGAQVRSQAVLKLHAKLIVADEQLALIGSVNIHRTAFESRRELSLLLADAPALARLVRQFEQDWQQSQAYVPPDPLTDVGAEPAEA